MFFNTTSEPFASMSWTTVSLDAKFVFQLVFAATTATVVSGAMAKRTKFVSYMFYSAIVSLCIYPVSGHRIWGGGWLADKGFWDFAGATVVHSCSAGWLAAGVFALIDGPGATRPCYHSLRSNNKSPAVEHFLFQGAGSSSTVRLFVLLDFAERG